MGRTISQRELRNDSGEIMRRVQQGESFIVTRNGTPIADLLPHNRVTAGRPPRFVPVDVIGASAATLADWGVSDFTRERRDLDVAVDDVDTDPWDTR